MDITAEHTKKAIEFLLSIIANPDVYDRDRIEAARILLSLAVGGRR